MIRHSPFAICHQNNHTHHRQRRLHQAHRKRPGIFGARDDAVVEGKRPLYQVKTAKMVAVVEISRREFRPHLPVFRLGNRRQPEPGGEKKAQNERGNEGF